MAETIIEQHLKFASKAPAIETRYEFAHVNGLVQLKSCPKLDSTVCKKIKSYLALRYKDTNEFHIEYDHSTNSPNCLL